MEPNFSGFVIDPAKCSQLSLEEKRELVHEISRWANNAPEILQSWSRQELLQMICAEMGKVRKYTGVTKPKMIAHLLRLVSDNQKRNGNKAGLSSASVKKHKKEHLPQFATDVDSVHFEDSKEEQVDKRVCQNVACRATLSSRDAHCKRCSCCICHHFDENKDPTLWLICSSESPYHGESCGVSCHLKCALKNEKAGISKNGYYTKLDGSFYCVACGKVNWLIGSWRKQLLIAKDARRVDMLSDRLSLSHKILKGTERYKELHNIVNEAVKKLKKEVGPLDKISALVGKVIVNRLVCGAEIQKLCAFAVESADSMIGSIFSLSDTRALGPQALRIQFEDVTPTSIVVSLQFRDVNFDEKLTGCMLWHRSSDMLDYPDDPTFIILRPDTKNKISGLNPSTKYDFKASLFSNTKELGTWEARCVTQNLNSVLETLNKVQESVDQPMIIEADSQRGSTNSSDNNQAPKLTTEFGQSPLDPIPVDTFHKPSRIDNCLRGSGNKVTAAEDYEYCVKVIRWLECEGYMEMEFRVKFLTWFSLKATAQERRVVSAFINVLIDDPAGLVDQLADAFMDGICNKQAVQKGFCSQNDFCSQSGFCSMLWHKR